MSGTDLMFILEPGILPLTGASSAGVSKVQVAPRGGTGATLTGSSVSAINVTVISLFG